MMEDISKIEELAERVRTGVSQLDDDLSTSSYMELILRRQLEESNKKIDDLERRQRGINNQLTERRPVVDGAGQVIGSASSVELVADFDSSGRVQRSVIVLGDFVRGRGLEF